MATIRTDKLKTKWEFRGKSSPLSRLHPNNPLKTSGPANLPRFTALRDTPLAVPSWALGTQLLIAIAPADTIEVLVTANKAYITTKLTYKIGPETKFKNGSRKNTIRQVPMQNAMTPRLPNLFSAHGPISSW